MKVMAGVEQAINYIILKAVEDNYLLLETEDNKAFGDVLNLNQIRGSDPTLTQQQGRVFSTGLCGHDKATNQYKDE
jgi:hypothetical protein